MQNMKPTTSKTMTPRSLMNQRKAVESRGAMKSRTPTPAPDENKRPGGIITTPGTPTSHFMWKPNSGRRDGGVTPLGVSGKMNRRPVTPSTPTRPTPTKSQLTPTRSDSRTVLFEFEHDLLITPCSKETGGVSVSHTSSVHVDHTPGKSNPGSVSFKRSHSASSLSKSKKAKMKRSVSEARLPSDNADCNTEDVDGELSRIAVGVRVRPLQTREHGNTVIVDGTEVKIASELGSAHSFTLDHVFGPSTSQEQVYDTMVKPLLDSAFQGYNACLFAYGQTGSGKTYSMMGADTQVDGIGEHTGIIPRFCHELIDRVSKANKESGGDNIHTSTTVEVSYLEVYNEKIRDLLFPPSQPLRVREHPVYGPYIADLSKLSVNTFNDIQRWISEGNKQRASAATEMNEKSSRSHSLFMVLLTQSIIQNNETEGWTHEHTRTSRINLVDLAGSERIAHSSVSSDRLREGVSINRSLMTLGKVISALVEKRSFVPYRESVLTWLLKESLGGNSRTGMLATVSPCSSHQDETIATLRYATQARSILNTVRVNESPQNKIIRELRAEIERLKVFVDGDHSSRPSPEPVSSVEERSCEEVSRLRSELKTMKDLVENLQCQLENSEKDKIEMEKRETDNNSELEKLKSEYDNYRKTFQELVGEHEKCLELCNDKEQALQSFKRLLQTSQDAKRDLHDKLLSSVAKVKRLNKAVDELELQKTDLSNKLESMESSVEDWKSDLKSRKIAEEELKVRAESAEQELETLKGMLTTKENETRLRLDKTDSLEKDVEKWKSKIKEIKLESEKLSHFLEEEKLEKEHWKQQFEQCNIHLEQSELKVNHLQEELNNYKTMLDMKQREMDDWFSKREDMERQMAETSGELEEVRESLRSISVQVAATADHEVAKVSVSVQASRDDRDPVKNGFVSEKEFVMLQQELSDLREDMKLQSDNHQFILAEATVKNQELEDKLKNQKSEMDDLMSELDLLRELESKYKDKLDRSLQDNEVAWNKKYDCVNSSLKMANERVNELTKELSESQLQVKLLIDRLSQSNLDRQVSGSTLVKEADAENKEKIEMLQMKCTDLQHKLDQSYRAIEVLEKKSADLQLKLDQKNNLILELERVANRSKEETIMTQTYATELKRQFDLIESQLKESKQQNNENTLRIDELESQLKNLEEESARSKKHTEEDKIKLSESAEKISLLENNLKLRDQQLNELHSQFISTEKMLQEQMSIKFEELKSRSQEANKYELDKQDVVTVENIRYKAELELTKDQLSRKKKRLEKMKSKIDKLEDVLISTMRQSTDRKNYLLIKSEHAKVFECMMETSYLFHWEYLLRKARTYAHKYHIPYEFERFDDTTVEVKHLLYNAKSYWFRIDFNIWFDNIEKNDKWCRELDEKMHWEVDFGNYYNIPNEKPGALCPLDEAACGEVELYCCKPGLLCPNVWKKTIVQRHLSGLQDDAKCLLIYFKTSKNQDVIELLQLIGNLAEQIRDKLSTKT